MILKFYKEVDKVLGRNPFLSRAGFDLGKLSIWNWDNFKCRNPFLSRAGFDKIALGGNHLDK